MGIAKSDIDGTVCYGHGGFWGTLAYHCPAIDLTVTAAANLATSPAVSDLAVGAIRLAAAAVAAPK
jgi:hypothetical protein